LASNLRKFPTDFSTLNALMPCIGSASTANKNRLIKSRNLGTIIRSTVAFGFFVLLRRSKRYLSKRYSSKRYSDIHPSPITETVVLRRGIDQTNILLILVL